MSATIGTECPHCHHRGTLSHEVERGRKIRCASCRQAYAYEPHHGLAEAESGAGDPAVKVETWDEAVGKAKLADAAKASESGAGRREAERPNNTKHLDEWERFHSVDTKLDETVRRLGFIIELLEAVARRLNYLLAFSLLYSQRW